MSLLPAPPQPIDDPSGSDNSDDSSNFSATKVANSRARSPGRDIVVQPLTPPQRAAKYLFFPVSVAGFPKGVKGDAVVNFFRAFGPVPGPGGVRHTQHAWGLEVVLILASQELATEAIDAITKRDTIELTDDADREIVRSVRLLSPLTAKIKHRAHATPPSALASCATTVVPTGPPQLALPPALPYTFLPPPWVTHMTAPPPWYAPTPSMSMLGATPLPQGYMLVPDPTFW